MNEVASTDLDSPENIRRFIDLFYQRVLSDPLLRPIFVDIADIDVEKHKAIISSYWQKLLLGDSGYKRHTMNIHRAINKRHQFQQEEFQRWLGYFTATVDEYFAGPKAERAKHVARHIAANMENAFR